jgi:hypothetical protein
MDNLRYIGLDVHRDTISAAAIHLTVTIAFVVLVSLPKVAVKSDCIHPGLWTGLGL